MNEIIIRAIEVYNATGPQGQAALEMVFGVDVLKTKKS